MSEQPATIHLADYQPPHYRVESIDLVFDLAPARTLVHSRLQVRARDTTKQQKHPFTLDGDALELTAIRLDGESLDTGAYSVSDTSLEILDVPAEFTLEIETAIDPQANTKLEGLYLADGIYCTQCEAEGFRRITFFPDRPDVMATYRVTIRADRTAFPVLLSNGNLIDQGDLDDGRHFAVWHDPFPKPSYLFALVVGDLGCLEDTFATASGRAVRLCIYSAHGTQDKCRYAMEALKHAMRWDEDVYGLEYDLDLFNIVAVNGFNMGAMENKSLNVFNAKYVLADADTATDDDYAFVEAIVAHEYFHNWTGNRVTCRDWFQLSLKEGLTVFRDQQFSADMRSGAVKRIEDVRALRARQFPEDSGPLAHPVRPASYIEINNFYTATVYEKGAEVIRMMHRLLSEDGFRKGMDLYFTRHDGEAVTCDDFAAAMADANGVDLAQFCRWYGQAGTPELHISGDYDAGAQSYILKVVQTTPPTPAQPGKLALHMPFAIGLLDHDGNEVPLRLDGEPLDAAGVQRTFELREAEQTYRFIDVAGPVVASVNRGFAAPVKMTGAWSDDDRAFLMAHDADPFNRWEAAQQYATDLMMRMVAGAQRGEAVAAAPAFIDALRGCISSLAQSDKAFLAHMLVLPSEGYLAEAMDVIDVDAIHEARETLRRAVAQGLKSDLLSLYRANQSNAPYSPDAVAAGQRALKNTALGYLALLDDAELQGLLTTQYAAADNMTDRMASLRILADLDVVARREALEDFYRRFEADALVLDKWFALQSASALPDTLQTVEALLTHPKFTLKNPNRVRALIGAFTGNQVRFHAADGAGFTFLADRVLELDKINPQVAARLLTPLGRWRRFDEGRQRAMKAELTRILAAQDLSRDVYEIASKSLG